MPVLSFHLFRAVILALGWVFFASYLHASSEMTPLPNTLPFEAPSDPIQLHVSLQNQTVDIFVGGKAIARSRVSTGKYGHGTPTGVFSILHKKRKHFSNLYNNAPMPFMQRLTWSGIAFHESKHVPNYPASHGCIRLPRSFAKQLFPFTQRGSHVIISGAPVAPKPIDHALLPISLREETEEIDDAAMQPPKPSVSNIVFDKKTGRYRKAPEQIRSLGPVFRLPSSDKPVRIFISKRDKRGMVREAQRHLMSLGYDVGPADGIAGPKTVAAIQNFERSIGPNVTGRVSTALLDALAKRTHGGVSKNGHLYVRQGFKPLFDAPITLLDSDLPLGSHIFVANRDKDRPGALSWTVTSLADQVPQSRQKRESERAESIILDAEHALDRIVIPNYVMNRLEALTGVGTSLALSDHGISRETTEQGTDFILLTKETFEPRKKLKKRSVKKRLRKKRARKKIIVAKRAPRKANQQRHIPEPVER